MNILLKDEKNIESETLITDCECIEYDKDKNKIILTMRNGTQLVHYCKFNEDIEAVIKIKIWRD